MRCDLKKYLKGHSAQPVLLLMILQVHFAGNTSDLLLKSDFECSIFTCYWNVLLCGINIFTEYVLLQKTYADILHTCLSTNTAYLTVIYYS